MNYVSRSCGRSASTTLKLADGVTVIGRHDDYLIRIKSSQVSQHCGHEVADKPPFATWAARTERS